MPVVIREWKHSHMQQAAQETKECTPSPTHRVPVALLVVMLGYVWEALRKVGYRKKSPEQSRKWILGR